jgi:uncharacterized protein HemX
MDIEVVSVDSKEKEVEQAARRRKQNKKSSYNHLLLTLLLVVLWGTLVYGGYWYVDMRLTLMQEEINRSMLDVQETNNLYLSELNNKMLRMQEEIENISLNLEKTGREVTTSGSSAREELNKRIKELDTRLEELAKSLEILKESKGEIN